MMIIVSSPWILPWINVVVFALFHEIWYYYLYFSSRVKIDVLTSFFWYLDEWEGPETVQTIRDALRRKGTEEKDINTASQRRTRSISAIPPDSSENDDEENDIASGDDYEVTQEDVMVNRRRGTKRVRIFLLFSIKKVQNCWYSFSLDCIFGWGREW